MMVIEARSKGMIDINNCMEIAPKRMRTASLRDMPRNIGMIAGGD